MYKIWRDDYGQTFEDADNFRTVSVEIEDVGEEYARHYFNNCDGWECAWPLVFCIADEDDKLLGKVSVELEHTPYFSGQKVKT